MDSQSPHSGPVEAPQASAPEQPTSSAPNAARPSPGHDAHEPAVEDHNPPGSTAGNTPAPAMTSGHDSAVPDVIDVVAAEPHGDGPSGSGWRPLHPLPRGLVELYGLLAVLFVLVPEWMAGGALLGFRETRDGSLLPPPSGAWKRLPELRLASLSLGEMRLLARQQGLQGYGRESRGQLTARLLRRLRRQP
jgi:hypothetical protein